MNSRTAVILSLLLLLFLAVTPRTQAEDSDRLRPYFRFHNGEIGSLWDLDDMWSFALGANLDRHWGGELGIDFYERDLVDHGQRLSEVGAWHLVPQVRLRMPVMNGRFVPYLIGGLGASFLQSNDRKKPAFGRYVKVAGTTFTMTGGAGIEYFTADNMAFGFEAKYFWLQPITGNIDGRRVKVDLSAPTFTFGFRVYTKENRPRPLADSMPTPPGRFYVGVLAGGAVLTDDQWVSSVSLMPEPSSFGSINQTGRVVLGWDFSRQWGVELAMDSLEYRINVAGFGNIGEYGMGTVIPKVRYRMPLADGRWVPYLTAGMGVVYGEFNDKTVSFEGLAVEAKGFHPALSVGAGVDYFLIRNLSFLVDVDWLYTRDRKVRINNAVGGRGDISAFMFHVGFRAYLFD